jgi:hypothetical protein
MKSDPNASAQPKQRLKVLTHRSEGQFDPTEWRREGDHLFASAKAIRATWVVKRRKLSRKVREHQAWMHGAHALAELDGLPKASHLLLGYSLEMYLKAGIARAYWGCTEELFDRDVRKFSHDFKKLAKVIGIPLSPTERRDLKALQQMVLYGARYPVKPTEQEPASRLQAERMRSVWEKSEFTRLRHLVLRLKAYCGRIDSDPANPASLSSVSIDEDGFIVFRCGGNLPARITYRFSSAQQDAGDDNLPALRSLVAGEKLVLLERFWDEAIFIEDPLTPSKP